MLFEIYICLHYKVTALDRINWSASNIDVTKSILQQLYHNKHHCSTIQMIKIRDITKI